MDVRWKWEPAERQHRRININAGRDASNPELNHAPARRGEFDGIAHQVEHDLAHHAGRRDQALIRIRPFFFQRDAMFLA